MTFHNPALQRTIIIVTTLGICRGSIDIIVSFLKVIYVIYMIWYYMFRGDSFFYKKICLSPHRKCDEIHFI